ncbi:MAG: ubiquitin carboxyl-terminal hydrolase [Puniceicoccales bacterium]|jgi:uncharacterized UBP type Zn finger protein|nr:ubiquitin carboxyl-terminal hydrolase [Puniceicoccales bacterium]
MDGNNIDVFKQASVCSFFKRTALLGLFGVGISALNASSVMSLPANSGGLGSSVPSHTFSSSFSGLPSWDDFGVYGMTMNGPIIPQRRDYGNVSNVSREKVGASDTSATSSPKGYWGGLNYLFKSLIEMVWKPDNTGDRDVGANGVKLPDCIGLPNLGNSCYINSAMQLLFSIPEFRKAILSSEIWDRINVVKNSNMQVDEPNTQVIQVLRFLFQCMNTKTVNLEVLRDCYPDLGYRGEQEDCVEFMTAILNDIEAVLPELTKLFRYDVQTTISSNSKAKVLSRFKSVRDEAMIFHPLPIDLFNAKVNTLENVLERAYNTPEDIEGWEVIEKGIKIPAQRIPKITEIPAYMFFQIERFDWEGNKLDNPFDFPSKFDMKPYCVKGIEGETSMELCGIIVHCGESIVEGHYFALVKNERDEWIEFNDESVRNIKGDFIDGIYPMDGETPYILLYRKKNTINASW